MNRPLFLAVIAFALGEVIYVLTEGIQKTGIAIVVPVFCALIYGCIKHLSGKRCLGILFVIIYSIGMINMHYAHQRPGVDACVSAAGSEASDIVSQKSGGKNKNVRVDIEGIVIDEKQTATGKLLYIKVYITNCKDHFHKDSYKAVYFDFADEYRIGDYFIVSADIEKIEEPSNPGEFDKENYYDARKSLYQINNIKELSTSQIERMDVPLWDKLIIGVRKYMYDIKSNLAIRIDDIAAPDTASVYKGILLGDKSSIPKRIKLLFMNGGISHILAISALHISMVVGILGFLLSRLGLSVYQSGFAAFVLVLFYGVMTGFSMSTIRAVIMLFLVLLGKVLGRNYDLLTGMSVALLIMLIGSPDRITDASCIMSFTAIIGIAAAGYIMKSLCRDKFFDNMRRKHRIKYAVLSSVVFQLCLTLVMLPVNISLYYEIYLYSPILNLIVVPLMSIVVISGLAGLFCTLISGFLGSVFIKPGAFILKFFINLCSVSCKLPFSKISVGHLSIAFVILYYLLLAFAISLFNPQISRFIREKIYRHVGKFLSKKEMLKVLVCIGTAVFILMLSLGLLSGRLNKLEKVVFLDVSQGDGAIIQTSAGDNILVDGGSMNKKDLWEYTILPALKYYGISKIDYWFISHSDIDHTSGILCMLDSEDLLKLDVENVVISKNIYMNENTVNLISKLEEADINVIYFDVGDYIQGEDFCIEALYPGNENSCGDSNEASLCIGYNSENLHVLFTGDIGTFGLDCLLEEASEYDIIKLPHHGSRNSYNEEFYKRISGKECVISCGKNSVYGHPHKEVVDALEKHNCVIHRTDLDGAVIFKGE